MVTKTKDRTKCRICGKVIYRGGVHMKGRHGQIMHFHKACRAKLLSSQRRVYGREKYPKESWEK